MLVRMVQPGDYKAKAALPFHLVGAEEWSQLLCVTTKASTGWKGIGTLIPDHRFHRGENTGTMRVKVTSNHYVNLNHQPL